MSTADVIWHRDDCELLQRFRSKLAISMRTCTCDYMDRIRAADARIIRPALVEPATLVDVSGPTLDRIEDLMVANAMDPAFALETASVLMASCFCDVAGCTDEGAAAAARRVTAVADVFVAWLRRPVKIRFGPATVTEQDTGEIVSTAGGIMATIDTSQVVTWDVDPEDDRGFDVDVTLDVVNSNDAVATVVFIPKTDTELAKVQATAVAPGSTLITVSVPGSDPLISGSLAVDVVPGGVATIEFGEPVVTEQTPSTP